MDRHDGFREFVLARQQALMRTAYLLTGDAHLAEDLLQSVLAKVVGQWGKLSRGGNPEAYIRRSLVNQYVSWRRRPSPELPSAEVPQHGVSHDDATLDRIVLRQALAKLAPRQRAVIVLRFWEDLTEAQTAEVLGCSVGNVKSQAHRALHRLRTLAPELAHLLSDLEIEGVSP